MPNATELAIDTSADALTLATTIFGNGVTVGTATLTGAVAASATYSGADATLGGIAPADEGIILSTGNAADFTNSSGTTDTNISDAGANTDHSGAGDTELGAVTGQTTFDAVVLEATFTPDGDYITMLFTFSSEEYLEYVNGGVNDAFGVWVNGTYVPFSPVDNGIVSIDTVNNTTASNLYLDNPIAADTYNTEMDGTTQTLSITAAVDSGASNTIRIALGDGGDGLYDTNVLIAANSVQTIAVAFDDTATIEANTATTIDVLANDIDTTGLGLTITEINGVPVVVGQTVTLPTGEQITLNADNTLTVLADGDLGSEPFTYTVVDSAGNEDVAFITLTTEADIPLNYVVEGTSGAELIDSTYTLDPQGDVIDGNDALDASNDDSVQAGAGNDTVDSGLGNDTIDAGLGNDRVLAGAGNDSVIASDGNDTVFGEAGNDTLLGGEGADALDGDAGADSLDGGSGNDTLIADSGNDTLIGGAGNDEIYGSTGNNLIDGGADNDLIFGGDMAETISGGTEMDTIDGGGGDDFVDGGADADTVGGGAGADTVLGGAGDDRVSGGAGNDSLSGGTGADTVLGDDGDDVITLEDGFGNDVISGGENLEAKGDTLDLSAVTEDLKIDLTALNPEAGSVSNETDTATFTEIENIVLGAGVDTLILADGSGDDSVGGFDAPTQDISGAWTGVDQLDVSGLTDLNGAQVNTDDVIVSDTNGDGTGDAILIFPGGESLTLTGVPATTFNDPEALEAIGIPMPNYIVEGTAAGDVINSSYTGDPEGDMVDANDNATGTNDDSIVAGAGNDTVTAGAGADTISGGDGSDIISGNVGDDVIFGEADDDLLYGGDGNDTIDGGSGNDVLQGGIGNDSLIGGAGNDNFDGGDGSDTIDGGADNDNIDGDAGDDSIIGGTGNDSIWGGDGNDTISGGDGTDAIYGGTGNDNISGGAGGDYIQLTSGNDTVDGGDDADNIDVVSGGHADGDVINVQGGTGGVDNDTLDLGDWTYYRNLIETTDADGDSTSGSVEVQDAAGNWVTVNFGEIENLTLPPPAPNYIVEGTDGADLIDASYLGDPEGDLVDGNDALDGSNNDSIEAGAGDDYINSADGNDTVMAGTGNDTVQAGVGDDIVFGEAGNDLVFGFGGNDTILGGDGNDIINGMTGNDLLDGGADADTFVVENGFGSDTIVGGEGTTTDTDSDLIRVNSASVTDPVTVIFSADEAGTLSDGTDTLSFSEIERIRLADNNDLVDGSATTTNINVEGMGGDDSIIGGSGGDNIDGGTGNDTLQGGAGADDIIAGSGDDVVEVAQGDTVSGGDGDDTFTLVDLAEAGTNTIFINGGEGGETGGDTLDLNGIADRTTINITNPIDVGGGISGTVQLLDGTIVDFANIENIICFVPGTMIATHAGLRRIEDLSVGDPVMTQDNGIQKIGWIGKTTVCARNGFAPVHFAKSVFPGATDDLIVSPQHRMLIKGYRAELLFGQSEVLMPAIHMINDKDITRQHQESVTYIHIMFEQHEIIFANGIPAESFHPGAFGVDKLEDKPREELFALFPELRSDLNHYGPTARMALKAKEAKVLAELYSVS